MIKSQTTSSASFLQNGVPAYPATGIWFSLLPLISFRRHPVPIEMSGSPQNAVCHQIEIAGILNRCVVVADGSAKDASFLWSVCICPDHDEVVGFSAVTLFERLDAMRDRLRG